MNRLLILVTLPEASTKILRQYQAQLSRMTGNQLALKYPVHITLRGPFLTGVGVQDLRSCLQRVCGNVRPFQVVLNGPVFVDPDLCWFEVNPASEGYRRLQRMHNHLEDELRTHVARDDIPESFKKDNYRAHVTIGWGVDLATRESWAADRKSETIVTALEIAAIAAYPPEWPSEGVVEIVETVRLEGIDSARKEKNLHPSFFS